MDDYLRKAKGSRGRQLTEDDLMKYLRWQKNRRAGVLAEKFMTIPDRETLRRIRRHPRSWPAEDV